MKKLLLSLLLMLVTLTVFSQEELKFSKVIQSETKADKKQLYAVLRSFVATYYHNSKEVIQMDDKDAGILICKATSVFNAPDGRVRVEVFHFFHHNKPGNQAKAQLGVLTTAEEYTNTGMQKKYHNKIWKMLKKHAEDISNDIFVGAEEAIKENVVTDNQEEEW